jgi:hypothetical protein
MDNDLRAETGWLIERRDKAEPHWLTVEDEMFDWTTDSLKALRMCRREDADRLAEIFSNEDIMVNEHQWG